VKLYSYWRSQASYRVRIALALKGLRYEIVSLDLLARDQFADNYRALNPEMVVPTLIDGDAPALAQSLAILEYLDEKYPSPPLLPSDTHARARARAIAQSVAMDAHPFIVPRVRKYLEHNLNLDEATRTSWLRHWLEEGSRAAEEMLSGKPAGPFCLGEQPTMADICLTAHLVSGEMLCGLPPRARPGLARVFDACMKLDAFSSTHPMRQPGAPSA
jgi:maleylacetoacetate isomerase/maleylpyruvate isomerase